MPQNQPLPRYNLPEASQFLSIKQRDLSLCFSYKATIRPFMPFVDRNGLQGRYSAIAQFRTKSKGIDMFRRQSKLSRWQIKPY
jgi:hypothetical protein